MAKQKDYLLESDRNIFLTGKAGTGKTYRIREFVEKMESEGKKVLVCAPTGTAAVNAGGETAHSLFGIPIPCYGVSISKTPAAKIKVLAKADAIVIDEVSMMRCDAFSYAIRVVRKAEKEKGGRIRLILTGDYSQLPPVVPKKEEKMLKKFGYDVSGYAFTTKEWASLNLKVVELTKIYRQEEQEFVENLAKVRDCDTSCIDYFNQFVDESYGNEKEEVRTFSFDDLEEDEDEENAIEYDLEETFEEDDEPYVNPKLLSADCVVLCGTNAEAERINQAYLNGLESTLTAYSASKKGRNATGIVDDVVLIKEGCKVMFTVNDVVKNRYQNGTMGTVTMCHKDHVSVRLEDGKLVSVYPHEYTNYSYKVTGGELTKSKVGSVKQMPLKVAAAVTIHKSQGKTFEKAIISPSVFAAGQLYVALSRVKSPEGLILTEPITEKAFVENEIVSKFYKNGFTYELPKKSTKSKTVLSTEELDEKVEKERGKEKEKKSLSTKKEATKKDSNRKTTSKNTTTKTSSKKTSPNKTVKKHITKVKTNDSKKTTSKATTKKTTTKTTKSIATKKTTTNKSSTKTATPKKKETKKAATDKSFVKKK